ncbi:B12-binding domain-containing radical SAM protein [Umezawaea endophytica]|uniref:Radical SAM protein n=1 Tax=Umezawaea endophytica TaxID=1654476 RepID=A0A9X2VHN2_9PSEU|nr:radical SAM protein [Umezawaea endophytica]MCS7476811.1 radical SAM protein [Umezawaea endophytica]
MHAPQPDLSHYYKLYEREFARDLPEYFIPDGGLWEMPLWVAHLTALLDELSAESYFSDLGRMPGAQDCLDALLEVSVAGDTVLMSPLAQNFDLAIEVSRGLKEAGRRTVLGGNMAPLAGPTDATRIFAGQLGIAQLRELLRPSSGGNLLIRPSVPGINPERIDWAPEYRHLSGYSGQVPLLRLNASHGCLYKCGFCGDAWSKQLTLVENDAIAREVDQLVERFPDTKLIYIGDKTFGQSREAVANLLAVFAERPGFRFIVQTHVLALNPWVLDAMSELGVAVVEMGFESADTELLRAGGKLSRGLDDYRAKLEKIDARGMRVVLNVMGGLAAETEDSHAQTTRWLRECADVVWLANLYNFVPYPLIPDFEALKPRIHDWDFSHWREDAPVVFTPHHLTPERSWELFIEKVGAMTEILSGRTAGAVRG